MVSSSPNNVFNSLVNAKTRIVKQAIHQNKHSSIALLKLSLMPVNIVIRTLNLPLYSSDSDSFTGLFDYTYQPEKHST